ncbi:MAG TPA: homoserine O-acetyltransferase [Steroidobacteraceae bacterium]|nr:homoserine O-acetyltransferase [Steroidobacteraceae bacterium]
MVAILSPERRGARPGSKAAGGDARSYAALPDPFPMWRGGALHGARVAYESWGELNAARDNAILIFTGLSPPAHAASSERDPSAGWWERMLGPGLTIDTDRFFVICVNSLGSCFGSTGPASPDPRTGNPYRLTFPDLAVEDIARGGFELMRSLGIERLHSVVGPSLGGMVVLAFAAMFPRASRGLISISGTGAASPFAIALRSIQREAVRTDPAWRSGDYAITEPPRTGLRLARKLGTVTYRSAAEWRERFDRAPVSAQQHKPEAFGIEFAVEGYLEAQAERFVRTFDANCYLYLSRAMDRFDLAVHGGSAREALARSGLERALVIGVESDMLFAIAEQRAVAHAFESNGIATRFAPLPCLEGHDSFLIDIESFSAVMRPALE